MSGASWLEFLLPVRNPGAPFERAVESLLGQSERGFDVTIGSVPSAVGMELVDRAVSKLVEAGISARVVRPGFSMARVEHWNWLFHQSRSPWIKPLVPGSSLAPGYVAALRQRVEASPQARAIRCELQLVTHGGTVSAAKPPVDAGRLSPVEFLQHFPQLGNWLGGLANFAIERHAWRGAGGLPTQFPATSEYQFAATLACTHGIELMPGELVSFATADARPRPASPSRQAVGVLEVWLTLCQIRNHCLASKLPWPERGVWSGTWKQLDVDFLAGWKSRLKKAFAG